MIWGVGKLKSEINGMLVKKDGNFGKCGVNKNNKWNESQERWYVRKFHIG